MHLRNGNNEHPTHLTGQHFTLFFLCCDRAPDDSIPAISLMGRVSDGVKTLPQPVIIAKWIILECDQIMRIDNNASRMLSGSHYLLNKNILQVIRSRMSPRFQFATTPLRGPRCVCLACDCCHSPSQWPSCSSGRRLSPTRWRRCSCSPRRTSRCPVCWCHRTGC